MATKAKTKAAPKKKVVAKKTTKEIKSAKTVVAESASAKSKTLTATGNKSKKMLIIGTILLVSLIIVVTIVAVILGGKSISSDDEGIKIPSDYQKLEGEGFEIGYPDGYKAETNFGLNIISRQESDILNSTTTFDPYVMIFTLKPEDKISKLNDLITNDNCGGYVDIINETQGENAPEKITLDTASLTTLNGLKGCAVELTGTSVATQVQTKIKLYLLTDDTNIHEIIFAYQGEKPSDYDTFVKILRTFVITENEEATDDGGILDTVLKGTESDEGDIAK